MKFPHAYSALFLALSSHAMATDAKQNPKTDEIEVIEVSGHKLGSINHDTAASVSVLGLDEMERNQESELTQLLKELPGVDMVGSVAPLSGQPSIRGLTGERVHISVDNVKRKTESDGSSNVAVINSLGIDPSQLKQVQVLRGADSLTVGSGALGGSIRLTTKNASDFLADEQGFGARMGMSYQSVSDAVSTNLSAFHLADNLDTVLHISRVAFSDVDVVGDSSQQKDNPIAALNTIKNDSSRININVKNTWFIDDQQTLKSKLDWSETESKDQPYGQRQSLGIRYPTLSEDYRNDYVEGSVNYQYTKNQWIDLDLQAVISKKDYEEDTNGYIVRRGKQISFDAEKWGSTKRQSLRLANLSEFVSPVPNKLALEINWENETFEQHELSRGENSTFYGDSKAKNWSMSVIDQASLFDERLLVTAGLRYDAYDRSNNVFSEFAGNDDSHLSKELGLTFKVTDNINLYAKSAEAFRAPSVQELYKKREWRCHIGGKICYQEPQPNLKPETSDNIEVGIGFSWQNLDYADNLNLKLMYFDNKIKDYINNVPFMYYIDENGVKRPGAPGPGPSADGVPMATHRDYSAKNIGKLMSQGIEVEAEYEWQDISAYLGYSSMNMDVIGMPNFFLGNIDYTQQPYIDAPADKLTLNVNYQVVESLNVGLQWLKYREQRRLPQNYIKFGYGTDGYNLLNLNLTYTPSDILQGLTVVAGVDNLTDKRYLRAPASEARTPSETGRNLKVTVSYQF